MHDQQWDSVSSITYPRYLSVWYICDTLIVTQSGTTPRLIGESTDQVQIVETCKGVQIQRRKELKKTINRLNTKRKIVEGEMEINLSTRDFDLYL